MISQRFNRRSLSLMDICDVGSFELSDLTDCYVIPSASGKVFVIAL